MPACDIALDLDGTCCDFVGAVTRWSTPWSGITPQAMMDSWQMGFYRHDPFERLYDAWIQECADAWTPSQHQAFWADMDPLPWFEDLMRVLSSHLRRTGTSCTVLTVGQRWQPLQDTCAAGKQAWVERHIHPWIPGCPIEILDHADLKAGRVGDRILIDDREATITDLRPPSRGILVPQPWNSGYSVWQSAQSHTDRIHPIAEHLRMALVMASRIDTSISESVHVP
jgi:hypothetical protein